MFPKISAFVVIAALTITSIKCNPMIMTNSGQVKGITLNTPTGKSVNAFLAIPYAEPPTGSNRFLPPKPKKPWQDVLEASHLPVSCIQAISPVFKVIEWCISQSEMSEDCLYLNIWVPNPAQDKDAAVLVWIHGGSFVLGSSNLDLYDGATLAAEENVIVVSFNYRLSIFGFLHVKGTSASGNIGLLDQVEALKWINLNIAHFGGDPKRVTIFGESAGGASVSWLLMTSKSRGLFSSAIIQSGNPRSRYKENPVSQKLFDEWISRLNCSVAAKNNNVLQCLRELKGDVLVNELIITSPTLFKPIMTERNFLDEDPNTMLQKRQFHYVNVLLGTTMNDGLALAMVRNPDIRISGEDYLPSRSDVFRVIQKMIPHTANGVHNIVNDFYTDWLRLNDPLANRKQVIDLTTDYYLSCDTIDLATKLVEANRNVYLYKFNHVPSVSQYPRHLGSMHGDEIPFVFGRPLDQKYGFTQAEVSLSKKIMRYWANFAKYGNPNGEAENDAEEWPRYELLDKPSIELAVNISTRKAFRARQCAFWLQLIPEIIRLSNNTH